MLQVLAFATAILTAGAISVAAIAGPPDCAGSQQDMNRCASATLAAEDAELNQRYQAALNQATDAEARRMLQAAQRAWLAFRDANCAWHGDAGRGGSIRPMLEASCAEHITRQRLLELNAGLEEPEPGLVAGTIITRLRELAPAPLRQGVYWLPEGAVQADFDGNGTYDLAAVGLRPPDVAGNGGIVHVLILSTGSDRLLHADVPIGGNGFCGLPGLVRLEFPPHRKRPLLVVDDTACDALRFGLTAEWPPQLEVQRN